MGSIMGSTQASQVRILPLPPFVRVAQLVEHTVEARGVDGSIPPPDTKPTYPCVHVVQGGWLEPSPPRLCERRYHGRAAKMASCAGL